MHNINKQVILVEALEEANRLFKTLNEKNVFVANDYNDCIKNNRRIEFLNSSHLMDLTWITNKE